MTMKARISYTNPVAPINHIRAERTPAAQNNYVSIGDFAPGAEISFNIAAGNDYLVRLIAVGANGVDSSPSNTVRVTYSDGLALLGDPNAQPDAPSGVGVVYSYV
jgi:hypothetical protein